MWIRRLDASHALAYRELMLEAYKECLKDAGIDQNQLQAAWFSTAIDEVHVGKSGIPLSTTLRLPNIPVTHVENMCASGTEAFRGACYAVASGAADFALALGVEKLKDTGYGGLPSAFKGTFNDLWMPMGSAPSGRRSRPASIRRLSRSVLWSTAGSARTTGSTT